MAILGGGQVQALLVWFSHSFLSSSLREKSQHEWNIVDYLMHQSLLPILLWLSATTYTFFCYWGLIFKKNAHLEGIVLLLSSDSFFFYSFLHFFLKWSPHVPTFSSKATYQMEFSLKQVKSGYGPLYILRGQRLYFLKKMFISFSAYLDEMSHHVAFHLGLHCLSSELPVLWFLVKKKHAKFSNIFLACLICPICFCKQLMLVLSLCTKNNWK